MIVTENEAKTKDCPTQGKDKCNASECMMWLFKKIILNTGDISGNIIKEEFISDKGYCKLGRN